MTLKKQGSSLLALLTSTAHGKYKQALQRIYTYIFGAFYMNSVNLQIITSGRELKVSYKTQVKSPSY